MRLAWLIFWDLCEFYEVKYKETADADILDSYIVCLHKIVTVGYNVLQGYDKGHVTDSVGRAYSSGKNFDDMLADLRCNSGRMFNPDLVKLFDSEKLQEKVRSLITAEREKLYLEVFGKNVELIL